MRPSAALLAVLATGLAAFPAPDAFTGTSSARQYLDQRTAATITTMKEPLVFARERPSLAVNARDYVSLVAIDVNRGGDHQLYWFGFVWTTIDEGGRLVADAHNAEWLLLADTRPLALRRLADAPRDLGISEPPIARPVRGAVAVLFAADRESLDYVSAARQLALRRADGIDYALWRDARGELGGLLAQLSR